MQFVHVEYFEFRGVAYNERLSEIICKEDFSVHGHRRSGEALAGGAAEAALPEHLTAPSIETGHNARHVIHKVESVAGQER